MCGIAGIRNNQARAGIDTMLDRMKHRGPDDRGTATLYDWSVGHVRLAVIDPEHAVQPMSSRSGKSIIVYNGEIYNFKQLKEELGTDWSTESDTEVLLRLYESDRNPADWIRRLDGMYAFAIIGKKGLLLARDRLGIKPVYVAKSENCIVFGSEIKAVMTQSDRIMEFPPGYYYTSDGGAKPYYSMRDETCAKVSFEEAKTEVRRLVSSSIETRMMSDVPLGAFLSGGLDSSIIVAVAVRANPKLKTFSVGLEGSADILAARKVAEYLKTDHYERIITIKDAVDVVGKVIYCLESFDSALVRSAIPNYVLAGLAAKHVKVALSGEGADELFAGYSYLKELTPVKLRKELFEITSKLHNTNLQRCDRMSMAHGLEVRVPFLDNSELVDYAMKLPVEFKINKSRKIEKWVLREAFRDLLPESIIDRRKEKFADGAGIGAIVGHWAATNSLPVEREEKGEVLLRSAEERFYFNIFERNLVGGSCLNLVGRTKCP